MDIIESLKSNLKEKIIVYGTGLLITAPAGMFFLYCWISAYSYGK